MTAKEKVKNYTRYPFSSILIYNGVTILHYVIGGMGIILGYQLSPAAYIFGSIYVAFAFIQMYVIMPLVVCPNCVYYRLKDSRCISGMNVFSKKIAKEGNLEDFPNRSKGLFSHNNMYMGSKIIPVVAIIPALILNFSFLLLALFLMVLGLLLYRIFVLFPKIACIYCRAKKKCPNAISMGLHNI